VCMCHSITVSWVLAGKVATPLLHTGCLVYITWDSVSCVWYWHLFLGSYYSMKWSLYGIMLKKDSCILHVYDTGLGFKTFSLSYTNVIPRCANRGLWPGMFSLWNSWWPWTLWLLRVPLMVMLMVLIRWNSLTWHKFLWCISLAVYTFVTNLKN
jgi:hypothetical protein